MKEKIEKKKTAEDLLFDEFRDGLFCPDQRDSQSKSIEPSMMDELDQQEARLKKHGLTVETKRDFTGEVENLRTMSGSTKDENDQIVEFSFHAVYAQRFGRQNSSSTNVPFVNARNILSLCFSHNLIISLFLTNGSPPVNM